MAHHSLNPNIILGYHGCDKSVGNRILDGEPFKESNNDFDWLGPGVYFWEANPDRALSFAKEQKSRGRIKEPFVVGAALTLGNCIDTLNEASILALKEAHDTLKKSLRLHKQPMPKNSGGKDLLLKRLDCAVVIMLHEMQREEGHDEADSLRGLYHKGSRLYPRSAFYAKSHVQICVRNHACIKGVFRVS